MFHRLIVGFALLSVLLSAGANRAQAQAFDSFTGASGFNFPTATRTFIGQAFNMAASTPAAYQITGYRIYMGSVTAATYTALQANISIWNDYNPVAAADSTVFSNLIATSTVNLTPMTTAAGTFYTYNITLGTPIDMTKTTNLGVTINFKGDTGTGLADTTNLTAIVRNSPVAVGTIATTSGSGYYRNQSGRVDANFLGSDLRNLTGATAASPSAMAFIVFISPEPGTFALLIPAVLGVVVLRRRFRRK